jgi:hypothetical protein
VSFALNNFSKLPTSDKIKGMRTTEAQRIEDLVTIYNRHGLDGKEALAQARKDIFGYDKNHFEYSMMCIMRVLIGFALIMLLYYDFFIPKEWFGQTHSLQSFYPKTSESNCQTLQMTKTFG